MFSLATLSEQLIKQGTTWQFITKSAPWYGGSGKGSKGLQRPHSRRCLGGHSYISLSTLQTIIVDIEAVLNDHPLMYISSDLNDPEPLCPSHLLYGRRIIALPYPYASKEDISNSDYIPYTAPIVHESFTRQAQILKHFEVR